MTVSTIESTNLGTAPLSTIHMFWHGEPLSRVERLAMASFIACGHPVRLHTYDEQNRVPMGVVVTDAGQTIPRGDLFRHPKTGSMAQFADWFRYRVLNLHGGVWADTDVVCLAPLRYPHAEVFAWQDSIQINNAVLGLPAEHPLAQWMSDACEKPNRVLPYDNVRVRWRKWKRRTLQGDRRGNVKWGEYGPVGFTQAVRQFGYVDLALPAQHFYPVPFGEWRSVFEPGNRNWGEKLADARALHLWNEMLRRESGFDKDARFDPSSLFEQLCVRFLRDDS